VVIDTILLIHQATLLLHLDFQQQQIFYLSQVAVAVVTLMVQALMVAEVLEAL
jgi:hypothetical protein